MSDAKFTQGEWSVFNERVGIVDRLDSQENGMMREVAYIEKYDFPCEYIANAYLIAAAPKMYRGIERDIESLYCKIMDAKTSGEADSIQCDIDRKLKLLAEARGEL